MISRADTDTDPGPDPTGQELVPATPDGLTPRMARFCEEYVSLGSGNGAEAARLAGYAEDTARQSAWRLLRNAGVQEYVQRLTQEALAAAAPQALATMVRLLRAKSEFVQQQAAQSLLDRAGHRPPDGKQRATAGSISITIDLGGTDAGP